MFTRIPLCLLAACFIWLITGCGNVELAGSGSVETTNGFSGTVSDGGEPASGVTVSLVPVDFNPVNESLADSMVVSTDDNGEYLIENVEPGIYNLYFESGDKLGMLLGVEYPRHTDTLVENPEAELAAPGSLTLALTEFLVKEGGFIYIPGSEIRMIVDESAINAGAITLSDLPAASFTGIHYAEPDVIDGVQLLDNIFRVSPGTETVIGLYQGWSQRLKVELNTSDLSEDIINYPVLVRLDNNNFDFTYASSGGSDLRFAKSDSLTPLAFEIEQWDAAGGSAAIWVRLDTLKAGGSIHSFRMYAGKLGAENRSSGPEVFKADDGFLSVWHLGQAGTNNSDGYRESTISGNHGTGYKMEPAGTASGVIGDGQFFAGEFNYISANTPSSLEGDVSFTASFWMNHDYSPSRSWILFFGTREEAQGIHFLIQPDDSTTQFGAHLLSFTEGQNVFDVKPFHNTWTYVTTTYNQTDNSLKTYMNGILMSQGSITNLNLNPRDRLLMGLPVNRDTGQSSYLGYLDELRIEGVARDQDWIRMNYETQKTGSDLVQIE